jgi:hypothetical protein
MAAKKIYTDHAFQQGAKITLPTETDVPKDGNNDEIYTEGSVIYDGELRLSTDTAWKRVVAGPIDADGHTVIECEEFN